MKPFLHSQSPLHKEATLQMRCVRYWRTRYRPNQDEYYLLYKVHNEGKKSKYQAARDKALGIVAGAADINIDLPRHGYNGLRIEFKTLKGKQTTQQKRVQIALEKNGYLYKVIQTFEDFVELINWYLQD
ncbi:MAG: VRR-NUC domain-containing protein [Bacteroidia bacterium]|nr:VRR-NUC domain-containing protein [Bacteroidia bacterium]